MAKLKTYSIATDIASGVCDTDRLHATIKAGTAITNFEGIVMQGDVLDIYGDILADESVLDTLILAHDPSAISSTSHYILGLVPPKIADKPLTAINYKTELLSNIRLEPVYYFSNDGLLTKTEYRHEWTDGEGSHSKLVIEITETYTTKTSDASLNPSERAIELRTKTWKWAFEDGILDEVNPKVKEKPYTTSAQQRRVGTRRRENIISAFGDNVGMVLVFQGIATDEADANMKLKELARTFQTELDTYKIFGDEEIYQTISNDTSITWLDETVFSTPLPGPLSPYDGLYDTLLVDMQGKTLRTYAIEKLKGLVK